jgi:hypothetical protein
LNVIIASYPFYNIKINSDSKEIHRSKMVKFVTNEIRDLREVHEDVENGLIFEKNVSVPLKNSELPVRCNVYRPIAAEGAKFPVLVTYGPYGKDIPYSK